MRNGTITVCEVVCEVDRNVSKVSWLTEREAAREVAETIKTLEADGYKRAPNTPSCVDTIFMVKDLADGEGSEAYISVNERTESVDEFFADDIADAMRVR